MADDDKLPDCSCTSTKYHMEVGSLTLQHADLFHHEEEQVIQIPHYHLAVKPYLYSSAPTFDSTYNHKIMQKPHVENS